MKIDLQKYFHYHELEQLILKQRDTFEICQTEYRNAFPNSDEEEDTYNIMNKAENLLEEYEDEYLILGKELGFIR